MPHRNEQPTLFELTACDDFETRQVFVFEPLPPSMTPESEPSAPEGNVSPAEPEVFRAVSPWARMALHEVCATCGREIAGGGFVILDYEELGVFCDQDCGDKRFRCYLYEPPEEGC